METAQSLAHSLQAEVEKRLSNASDLHLRLESALKRIEFLEAEARENEALRRKLHNQVQDLKGQLLGLSVVEFG